jgi:hypothetical protein
MAKWREIAELLDSCHSLLLQEVSEPQGEPSIAAVKTHQERPERK